MIPAEARDFRLTADLVLHVSAPEQGAIAPEGWRAVTERAVAVWRETCQECALPAITVEVWAHGVPAPVRRDGLSTVRVRSDWCPDGARDRSECHDPARRAITHIHPDPVAPGAATTAFRKADIEVHLAALERDAPEFSLQERSLATLIHEVGHVWGLTHACALPDHSSCQAPEARRSVMYPHATEQGRALVMAPSAADVAALAAKYPSAQVVGVEEMAGWSFAGAVILGLAALGWVRLRGRRTYN